MCIRQEKNTEIIRRRVHRPSKDNKKRGEGLHPSKKKEFISVKQQEHTCCIQIR